MSPDRKDGEVQVIIAPSAGASCTASPLNSYIVASIDSLMKVLTPNNSSAQSKWQQVLDAIAANDPVAAQSALDNLIDFINLKYVQATTNGVTITDPATGQPVPIADFRDKLFLDMQCYVDKNTFDLNPNDPAKVFVDQVTSAGVYFPAGFVPQGYNVQITTPTGSPLTTLFDQHPSFINIKLVDANGLEPDYGSPSWPGFTGEAIVAVCFPGGLDPDVYPRLRLGHQSPVSGFEILEKRAVPQALADALSCGGDLDIQTTAFGRVIRSVAEFLLPEKLNAAFFAFGGVGGSPEEFSPFGAVDPGLSAFGGAGGSPEEFAPGIMPGASASGPAASTVSGGGTIVTGTADESDVTDPAQLPQVRVVTPSFATGVDGVSVTFELLDPDASGNDPITGPPSSATLCGATSAVTSGGGYASVPCINFGTTPGYKNLRVTFDPTGVDPLACIINAQGLCATTTTTVNFLVETVAGAATKLFVVTAPATAQAGEPLSPQPVIQLRDQNNNNVAKPGVIVTAALNGGGTLGGSATATTNASGVATFGNLEIQGGIGNRSLTFTSGSLASVTSGTIALQAGAAYGLRIATEPSTTAQAGVAFATQPSVQVVDEWNNDVATAGITVAAVLASGDGTLAGTLTDATDANGLAEFADLRIDGSIGDRTLKFTSTGLAEVTSGTTIGITPGTATKLVMVTQPSGTAAAGVAFATQPSVKLQDAWDNDVTAQVVAVTAGLASGDPALAGTLTRNTVGGVATFSDLRIDGAAGSRTLSFSGGSLAGTTSGSVVVGAGAAAVIRTWMPTSAPVAATSYNYGTGAEGVAVTDAPRVRVTDLWNNPVDGATVTWSPINAANGAVADVGSGGTTSGGGLARITSWTLGQGTSTLNASIAGAGPVTFTAAAGQVTIAACTVSGNQKKVDLAAYSAANNGYLGRLATKAVNAGLVRSAELAMSVTGQSSGTGGYPTEIRAYRVTSTGGRGTLLATGNPYNAAAPSDLTLRIPGDNGSPALIKFNLTPVAGQVVAVGEVIHFEVQVTAASNRTFQVWYNTKTTAGTTCAESKVFPNSSATTNLLTGTAIKGVTLTTRNYSY
jgi:hypothetical protein